jgi:cytochrome c oxidase assembly protein subunit 11
LAWQFKAKQHLVTARLGEPFLAFFEATNTSNQPITGTATFNVTPLKMGQYFKKIACFCFQEQTLQPGQTMEFPVSFFVDSKMLENPNAREVKEVTLSYTFFKKPSQ